MGFDRAYLCLNETRPEAYDMAANTNTNIIIPTDAEIRAAIQRAHILRAEVTFAFFARVATSLKSTARRLNFRKPNLVHTFLEA
jgi:hypothetical protein